MSLDVTLYVEVDGNKVELFWSNITHNLTRMAKAAGIYEATWRPDEHGFTHARDISGILRVGLETLKMNPAHFRQFDASNGWGTYDDFVPWLEEYLAVLEKYPSALIEVER